MQKEKKIYLKKVSKQKNDQQKPIEKGKVFH